MNKNYVVNKVIPPRQQRMTMEQVRMKILRREHMRRNKIQALFEEEYQQYKNIVNQIHDKQTSEDY